MMLPTTSVLTLYCTCFSRVTPFSHFLEWQQSVLPLATEVNLLRRRRPKVPIQDAGEAHKLLVRFGQFLDRGKTEGRIELSFR